MKKAETIVKEIDELEKELYNNYTDEDIVAAISIYEEKSSTPCGTCLSMIYEGCYDSSIINKEFKLK